MKGFAMKRIGEIGWVEKEIPEIGARDAPLDLLPFLLVSDIHTVWAGAIGDRRDMILGQKQLVLLKGWS